MKWLFVIFLIPTLVFSQIPSDEADQYDFSLILDETREEGSLIDTYDLRAMINYFLEDCKSHSIPIPNKLKVRAVLKDLPGSIVAQALGMHNDSIIHIEADPNRWHKSHIEKRWYILYHELGHDFLNLEHGEGGKMMFNISERSYTWYDFVRDKEAMFRSVNRSPYDYEQ